MSAPLPDTRLRRQAAFRQVDVTRAARAAVAAGLRVASIKIGRDGAIEILTAEAAPLETDAFSEWKAQRDARRAQRIDSAVKRLADGSIRTYHYAWRGGPRLEGMPGPPQFGGQPVTNIRNVASPHWRGWLRKDAAASSS